MRPAAIFLAAAAAAMAQTPQGSQPAQTPTAPAAESPAPPSTPWLTGSLDFGDRWTTNVYGSYPEYRSTVNLGAGPRLFGLDVTIADPDKRLFDTVNVRAYNWGDPYDTAHIDARKLGIYDFSFDYRSMVYFNDVPSFANPFAPEGSNQQSFDVLQRTASTTTY